MSGIGDLLACYTIKQECITSVPPGARAVPLEQRQGGDQDRHHRAGANEFIDKMNRFDTAKVTA